MLWDPCEGYAAGGFAQLHDALSGLIAVTAWLAIGIGTLVASWRVLRRDAPPSRAILVIAVSLVAGAALTFAGMLIETTARCSLPGEGSWSGQTSPLRQVRRGGPAYVSTTSHQFEARPSTSYHLVPAAANLLLFSGLSSVAIAFRLSTRRRGAR